MTELNQKSLSIHTRAIESGKRFKLAAFEIIESLREVEDDETYRKLGLNSLYQYAVKFMKLDEDIACSMINIMRKSRKVPELAEKIREGSISTSAARRICSVITNENKDAWLKLAETQSCKAIEKAVATENPKLAVTESLRYKSADRLELKLGVGEDFTEVLKLAKDVASQKLKRAISTEEILLIALKGYVDQNDLLRKAERAKARADKSAVKSASIKKVSESNCELPPNLNGQFPESRLAAKSAVERKEVAHKRNSASETNPPQDLSVARRINYESEKVQGQPPKRSHYIHSALKYAVTLRDQRRCRYTHQDGSRCAQTRWLDVHHVVHRSKGGTDSIDNLVTLCSFHHKLLHEQHLRQHRLPQSRLQQQSQQRQQQLQHSQSLRPYVGIAQKFTRHVTDKSQSYH